MARSLVSPADQKVTFVELFFDLVFVFSITQVVGVIAHDLTWAGLGKGTLVFWLVWWAWTQFTWALNAADTNHPQVQIGTLVSTGLAFLMAVALPQSVHGHALWFGSLYIAVRLLGLGLYLRVASANNPEQRSAVQVFGGLSLLGLGAVGIGSYLGGNAQYAWWGAAVLLDFVAAGIGGRNQNWDLHPEHFAERHGLFVIIALGESLIVAAAGLTSADWSAELVGLGLLAVAVTCALWWTYFVHPKPELDHAMESCDPASRAALGRDVFSLMHFPILGGIVAFAVGVETVVHHAHDPLGPALRFTFGLAIALYTLGTALATWRARGRILWLRSAVGIAVLGLSVVVETTPIPAFAGLLVALLLIAGLERRGATN